MSVPRTKTHYCDCEFCDANGRETPLTPDEIHQLEWNLASDLAWAIERQIELWTPARNEQQARERRATELVRIMTNDIEWQMYGHTEFRWHGGGP